MANPTLAHSEAIGGDGSPGLSLQTITATLSGNRVYLLVLAWESNGVPSPTIVVDASDTNIVDGATLISRNDDKVGGYEPGQEIHRFQTVASPTGDTDITFDPTTSIYGWNVSIIDVGDATAVDEDSTIVQSKQYYNLSNHSDNFNFDLDSAPTEGNPVIVIQVVESDDSGANISTPSGYTELYDNNDGPNPHSSIHWRDDLSTVTVVSPGASTGYLNRQCTAFEINAQTVASSPFKIKVGGEMQDVTPQIMVSGSLVPAI